MKEIEQIKLLKGTHTDVATTGQGCIMNVIAYLNNEPVITDMSECVCHIVRPVLIWFNDYLEDDERSQLLPFVLRAMGSRTDDAKELIRRRKLFNKWVLDTQDLFLSYSGVIGEVMGNNDDDTITRQRRISSTLVFLDMALPLLDCIEAFTLARINQLLQLSEKALSQ